MRAVSRAGCMSPDLTNPIAVLYSERSRQELIAQARAAGATYEFTDARGARREWLRGEYAYLAVNALSSLLHRFALKHSVIDEAQACAGLDSYTGLCIANAAALEPATCAAVARWLEGDGRFLLVAGPTNLDPALLGLAHATPRAAEGYTGWQWTESSPFGERDAWEDLYVTSYKGYGYMEAAPLPASRVLAELVELYGDLSSAATAGRRYLGPAVVLGERTLFIANGLFEYLGGVMQAHINVEEVRRWSNPTHWGDTLAYFVRELLRLTPARGLWQVTLPPFGSYDGVLQLRHDADHNPDESIDLSMLEYELQTATPATHYIMDPAIIKTRCTPMGAKIWVEATAGHNFIEAAQHNDSVEGDPPRWIVGDGLATHLRESDLNLGLDSKTAGRHMGFLVYPETIDAMDYLYAERPDLLGLCTFSLYDVIEYGRRDPDVRVGGKAISYSTYDHANPAVPAAISGYWFPYHVVVSTADRHAQLRGWDVTHDTDCDYARIEELFAGRNSKDPRRPSRLENGVFTIQYEVQLARNPFENEGRGHLPWLRYAISHAERCNFWLATKRMLYERMSDYQDLVFRPLDDRSFTIHNPTARTIEGMMARFAQPVSRVSDGSSLYPHIVGGQFVTLPPLPPGATSTLRAEPADRPAPLISQPNSNLLAIREARCKLDGSALQVRGVALRKSHLVVSGLAPEQRYIAEVTDARGTIRQRLTSRADGRLAVPILGQADNLIPFRVALHGAG